MNEQKITVELPNGDSLVAEICPYEYGQIAIGIVKDGSWIQDLAVVEASDNGKCMDDKFNVYVYGSEYDECFTKRFEIPRVPSNAL